MSAAAPKTPPAARPWLPTTLRLALGAVVLAAVGLQLSAWRELGAILAGARPAYLAGCVAVYFAGVGISCVKWRRLLGALGAGAPMGQLVRWYLAGSFAGNLLPSDVGGDVVRGYLAGRAIPDRTAVWASILAERLTGLAGLGLLAAAALLLMPALLGWSPPLVLGSVTLAALGVAGGVALALRARPGGPRPLARALASVRSVLAAYAGRPGDLLACLGYSLVYHLLTVLSLWLILLSLAPATPLRAALVAPIAGLIGLLPLTPGGLGVREGALAVLLGRAGVDGGVALAAALVSRALLWLVALSGLPVLLAEPDLLARARAQRRPGQG